MRDAAPSFINAFEQLLIIALTLAFPSLVVAIGAANIFWIFAGIGVLCTIYIGVMLSESNGAEIGQTELTSPGNNDRDTKTEEVPWYTDTCVGKKCVCYEQEDALGSESEIDNFLEKVSRNLKATIILDLYCH